jgi:type II secretory pathway component GspD/PulD (secretin)
LPALPSPCQGVPLPRMAILDVVMVRTEEIVSYGQGVNLLTGLNLLLGYNWNKTSNNNSGSGPTWTSTLTRTASLSNATNGIQYSLNIFGSGDSHAEVIARPSLIALDRLGSTFFSGSTVSMSISGQWGNSLQDKNIGVSMSVTPTFIDEETMLLAVKTGRTFAEPVQTGNFTESVSTSTNTVTANALLRFGETMVLSGLREREVTTAESGVPVLNRVPVIQYLFNRKVENDFSKHVLVLITPRKPAKFQDLLDDAERHRAEMERIGQRGTLPAEAAIVIDRHGEAYKTNLRAIAAKMGLNKYYQEFKTGDLSPRRFHAHGSLNRILADLRQLLYY